MIDTFYFLWYNSGGLKNNHKNSWREKMITRSVRKTEYLVTIINKDGEKEVPFYLINAKEGTKKNLDFVEKKFNKFYKDPTGKFIVKSIAIVCELTKKYEMDEEFFFENAKEIYDGE